MQPTTAADLHRQGLTEGPRGPYFPGDENTGMAPMEQIATEFEKFDPQTLWITTLLVLAFLATKFVVPRLVAGGAPFVDNKAVQERIAKGDEVIVLDVRTPGEFTGRLGHVPGAVNLPLADVAGRLTANAGEMEALKEMPIYVLCRTANRSPSAARLLRKRGFTDVSVIKGGMSAWKRAGLPVE